VCPGIKCLSYVLIVSQFALLGGLKNLFHWGLNPLSAVPSSYVICKSEHVLCNTMQAIFKINW